MKAITPKRGSRALAGVACTLVLLSTLLVVGAGASPKSHAVAAQSGLIQAGPSRSQCIVPDVIGTGLGAIQTAVSHFESVTGTTVNCLGSYLNGAPTWANWTGAWVTSPQYGYTQWVAEAPQSRQMVLQVDLIPLSLKDIKDPLGWEQSCANGDFDSYATALGTTLVSAGLGDSIIRLGAEANGTWETDFIGTTTREQKLWATCFDNEVTGMRAATGESFLFDWNPNACSENVPYANYYPGNAYVDIMGLDLYDVGCMHPTTKLNFAHLSAEPAGLTKFIAFATAHKKPMSFPEWGLASKPAGDDPGFITGVGDAVACGNFAFEEYFDVASGFAIPIDAGSTPKSVAAFRKQFG
jgi:hypothetical protein